MVGDLYSCGGILRGGVEFFLRLPKVTARVI